MAINIAKAAAAGLLALVFILPLGGCSDDPVSTAEKKVAAEKQVLELEKQDAVAEVNRERATLEQEFANSERDILAKKRAIEKDIAERKDALDKRLSEAANEASERRAELAKEIENTKSVLDEELSRKLAALEADRKALIERAERKLEEAKAATAAKTSGQTPSGADVRNSSAQQQQ